MERAIDARPDFAVTDENAASVAEICHRLDGLPLAIELAAARIRLMSPRTMLSRLGNRLSLLNHGAQDLPDRQQTLRNAIEWSYNLLSEGEKQLFRQLSVFEGGCLLEAAEAVCRAAEGVKIDLLDGVTSLLDKSLLRQEKVTDDEPRFGMLETIREYGREQLVECGEMDRVCDQHTCYFRQFAEAAEPALRRADAAHWVQRLEAEQGNLRAALAYAIAREDAEISLELAGALAPFWRLRGYWAEGQRQLSQVLALPQAVARTPARAKALAGAALMAEAQRDLETVEALYGEALAISRECGDRLRYARILEALGDHARGEGQISAAQPLYEESLALYRELNDRQGQASLLMRMGLMGVEARTDWKQVRTLLEQSRALSQELGDAWGVAAPSVGLSTTAATCEHDLEKARRYAEECLSIYRRLGSPERMGVALQQLACVTMGQGDIKTAEASLREGVVIAEGIGDWSRVACLRAVQGKLALQQGDLPTARARYEESLAIDRLPEKLTILGQIAARQQDHLAARSYYAEALSRQWELLSQADAGAVWRRFEHQADIARCLDGLASLAAAGGQPERAARLFGAAQVLRDTLGDALPPADQAEHEDRISALQAAMDSCGFASAWAEGQAMPLAQAIDEALSGLACP